MIEAQNVEPASSAGHGVSVAPIRRGWFRFSLRTMLLITMLLMMTLACCSLGWDLKIMHERQQSLAVLKRDGAEIRDIRFLLWSAAFIQHGPAAAGVRQKFAEIRERCRVPTVRAWLGDKPVGSVELPYFYGKADLTRVQAMFPEAEVIQFQAERH
jgi:hypothetical protein